MTRSCTGRKAPQASGFVVVVVVVVVGDAIFKSKRVVYFCSLTFRGELFEPPPHLRLLSTAA
jgi:hypothetical protein